MSRTGTRFPFSRVLQHDYDRQAVSFAANIDETFHSLGCLDEEARIMLTQFRIDLYCLGQPRHVQRRWIREDDPRTWWTANEIVEAYNGVSISLLIKVELLYRFDAEFRAQADSIDACLKLRSIINLMLIDINS